jgi:phosphatidylethanolamine/phosphatidyl-N-methylethanolamine N-methyltransferase
VVGAGTGLDLPYLPEAVRITAVDITPAMVHRVAVRAEELQRSVGPCVMDAQRLAFPDGTFDCVLFHLVLAVVPDPVACIREAARVLKPGGRISIFDKFLPDDGTPSNSRRVLNWATNLLFSDINRQLGPLLTSASLTVIHEESSIMRGAYRVVLAAPLR